MKLIRSTKCSLKFATAKKQNNLLIILGEYSKVVNIFIEYFWLNLDKATKGEFLKPIVDLPQDSWLSARLRKVAARNLHLINVNKIKFNSILRIKCPNCGNNIKIDFNENYLYYPLIDKEDEMLFWCKKCDKEWLIPYKIKSIDVELEFNDNKIEEDIN